MSTTSSSATARPSPSTASRSRSARASVSPSSGRTGRARRRCSTPRAVSSDRPSGRVRIEGEDVTGATPGSIVRRGDQPGARGTPRLRDAAGRGESPARRVRSRVQHRDRLVDAPLPPEQGRGAGAARAGLHPAPAAPRASRPSGGAHVRRPAADGRDRSRAHGRATTAGDRRALARPRAAPRAAARRVPAPPERGGRRRDPPRRPERDPRVLALRARVRARDRPHVVLEGTSSDLEGRDRGPQRVPRRAVGGSRRDDVLPARRGGDLDRLGVRDRGHVARPRVPRHRDRQLRPGRLRGPRRPAHVLARQARVAGRRGRARDADHGVRGDARRGRRRRASAGARHRSPA